MLVCHSHHNLCASQYELQWTPCAYPRDASSFDKKPSISALPCSQVCYILLADDVIVAKSVKEQ